jgi:hypothetical protein
VFEIVAPIQSPAKCEVRSVTGFLNTKGEGLAKIHKEVVAADPKSCLPFQTLRIQNKAGSTTGKRAGLTGKGSRSTAVLSQ